MNVNDYECPVSFVPVNENKVRIVAAQVFIISISYLITGYWLLIAFLIFDFFLRAFELGRFSILSIVASSAVKIFSLGNKPIDQAPKFFAARIGIILCLSILVVHTDYELAASALAIMLAVFSFLESAVGFCAGCYLYSIGKKIFSSSNDAHS